MEEIITLPLQWPRALEKFAADTVLPKYLTGKFCQLYKSIRQSECDLFSSQVSSRDYEWYLRAV